MEREGNNTESTTPTGSMAPTEQPQAPDSNVASNNTQPEASPVFQTTSEQPTQSSEQKPSSNFLRKLSAIPKKRVAIVAGIVVVAILIIVSIIIIIINLPSNNTADNTGSEVTVIEESAANDESSQNTEVLDQINQLGSADVNGMIKFIDDVVAAHDNGTGYQELTDKNIGNIYIRGMRNIYESAHNGLPGLSNDEKVIRQYIEAEEKLGENYGGTILRFAHAAEDRLQTADSALEVYNAEMAYGSQDTARQYKEIAIKRGSPAWNTDNEGGQ